jgi:eukaryotic-like serine/threonine-protein kinase
VHDRLKEAFEAAIQLQGAARDEYLARLRKEDAALAAELESLLAADSVDDDDAISNAVVNALASFKETTDNLWAGRELGPWRIDTRIASGGMGSVFRAERADRQYDQVVAIKIMAAQLLTPDAMRRFRTERQILANLGHPYIARLLDGGTTPEELPYLVMEYIDGQPIDAWCDAQQLNLRERIALFLKVCEAVEYAHRQLVVHRDLKPSNILVDASGTPKLLDFGIARLVDSDAVPGAPELTQAGNQALTPDYASPEQIRGEPVSVATDVYSLGVLLYTLLAGRLPFADTSSRPNEKLAAILDTEPARPSTAVTTTKNPDTGSQRRTTVSRLSKQLAGDLDNIVLMALRKEPARRYASVADFAADLRNYLQHRPVAARPDTLAYRSHRFLRRNALAVATGTVLVGMLIAFTANTLVQNERIARERDIAEQERATSERVSEFLVGLFEVADPSEARGNTVTARQVVDKAADALHSELNEEPAVRAELMQTLGRVYHGLGLYEEALRLLDESLAERQQLYGENSLEAAETLFHQGYVYEWSHELGEARNAHRAALAIRQAQLPADDPLVADSLFALGGVHLVRRDNETAYELLEQALQIRRALYGEQHADVGRSLNDLALITWRLGQHDDAARMWQQALEINRAALGEDHPDLMFNLNNVAYALSTRGYARESLPMYKAAFRLAEKTLGPEHPELLLPLSNYAFVLVYLGELDDAEALSHRGLVLNEQQEPEDYATRIILLSVLAEVHRQRNELKEAQRLLEDALEIKRTEGYDSEFLESSLTQVLLQQGDNEAAETYAIETLKLTEAKPRWGTGAARLSAHTTLAMLTGKQEHVDEAFAAAVDEKLWISSMRRLTQLVTLANLLLERGDNERAQQVIDRAELTLEHGPGREQPLAAEIFSQLKQN